jgi:hypothetical protein
MVRAVESRKLRALGRRSRDAPEKHPARSQRHRGLSYVRHIHSGKSFSASQARSINKPDSVIDKWFRPKTLSWL